MVSASTKPDRALFYTAPGASAILPISVADEGGVLVRTLWSGLSRGTERLVASGAVPKSEHERMRAPFQDGDFPFPVKYGYAAVGVVEDGTSELEGQTVFCLHPHQSRFRVPTEAVVPVPDSVTPRRAILAANMETALNAIWDGQALPGQRIAIVGGGVVGLLIAGIAAGLPGTEVTVVDTDPARAGIAEALGATFALPDTTSDNADLVFHTSATSAGLETCLALAGFEATIVEVSWHGAGHSSVPLGGVFHSQRLRLVSSQVGSVAASFRGRWTYGRRLAKAIHLLSNDRFDALITAEVAFDDLPDHTSLLLAPGAPGLMTAVRYS